MSSRKRENGFGIVILLVGVALLAVLGGTWYFLQNSSEEKMTEEEAIQGDKMTQKDDAIMEDTTQVLAGSASPLLDFAKADYDKALSSGKLIVLYFYANWCPICKAEFPKMQSAFNEFSNDTVIGFRVNYNDSDTDADEVALAKKFGVAYQHTKVFLRDGQEVLKSPETWEAERYLSEMTRFSQ